MANNQKNVQPKVVTTTTTTTSRRRGRRRRRTPRTATSSKTTVRKVAVLGQPRRASRRRSARPGGPFQPSSSTFMQKITATLGTVGANQGDKIELEMSALINPALMRESTGSNAYGPIQMYAANYNLWRTRYMTLKLNPLVGGSAVSGTAVRASLNLSGSPGSPNWSALGARFHKDTTPGRPLVLRIPGKKLLGPKEGWFLCNTKNDPQLCMGGSIEIHTYGKTMSTYKSEAYNGPLFLAELEAVWEFKNYNPEPGMLNLVKKDIREDPQQVKIHSNPGEPIVMSIPSESSTLRAILQADGAADATASEIIWQICDAAIDAASPVFPPPFSWLFKCGWWFIKRIANKNQNANNVQGQPNSGELTFQVFQSISDAQNGVPCISTGATSTTTITNINQLQLTQITPGNAGMQQESLAGLRRTIEPTLDPITIISSSLLGQAPLYGSLHQTEPLNAITMQGLGGWAQKIHTFSIHELNKPVFLQGDNEIDPLALQVNPYPIYKKTSSTYDEIGKVYAAAYAQTGRQPLHWTTCLWRAGTTTTFNIQGTNSLNQFIFVRPKVESNPVGLPNFTHVVQATTAKNTAQTQIRIQEGSWYLSVFASWAGAKKYDIYGVEYWAGTQTVNPNQEYEVDANFESYKVGIILGTAQPLELQLPVQQTSLTTMEILALREFVSGMSNQTPQFPSSSPPSEYDNMPPLEGEEEGEQGATGYTPPDESNQYKVRGYVPAMEDDLLRDTKNWVEFGHRKRPPTPFSPIEEEEEEDEEDSDLDDDDYAEPPAVIKNLLTPEAKDLYGDLRRKGLSHEQATKAAQAAFPHLALEAWDAAYHNAMADGLSPPTARDCAWAAVSDFLS
uniref:ORF2 n=1 Tax=Porcine astrovirus 1 TaxID=1239567 RepID=A0A7H0ZVK0_PASV1|nr:ORF2 [Mamastrovirus 3]